VHLVGFITKKFVTKHGHVDVKKNGRDVITFELVNFHLLARMWISRLLPLTLHRVYSSTHRCISAVCYGTMKQLETEIQQVEQDCDTQDLCVFTINVRAANNIYIPL